MEKTANTAIAQETWQDRFQRYRRESEAKAAARAQAQAEWEEQQQWVLDLLAYYETKGDKLMVQRLRDSERRGQAVVRNMTEQARERLREPKAIITYLPDVDRIVLYGEQYDVSTRLHGKDPREAQEELDELIGDYIELVVEFVGLGVAPWKWNGKAPWEQ